MHETGRDDETGKHTIRLAADWLAAEVDIRLQGKWLVLAGAAVVLLELLALD